MSGLQRVLPPIKIGGFHLSAQGMTVVGKPPLGDYESALVFAQKAHDCAGFWLADLLTYADSRPDWAGVVDSVIDSETLTEATVKQYRYVARNVKAEQRMEGLSFAHHAEVASLPVGEQTRYLTEARGEGWSAAQLRREIKRSKAGKVIQGQAEDIRSILSQVADAAWLAEQACHGIAHQDGRQASERIAEARKHLETCERHVAALQALIGRRKVVKST